MRKNRETAMFAIILIILASVLGCSVPGGSETGSTGSPENPDPFPFDPSLPAVEIGYSVYANIGNEIRRFSSSDQMNYEVLATDVDPETPQFYVIDDSTTGEFLVYARSVNGEGEIGHFLVVLDLDSDQCVYPRKNSDSQSLVDEFTVVGTNVVYSDNGTLTNYDVANDTDFDAADEGDFEDYVDLNSDDESYCNHFMTVFHGGMMTFVEHDPGDTDGEIHVMPYDGQPQASLYSIPYSSAPFGTLFHPTVLAGNEMVRLSDPEYCDTLERYQSNGDELGQVGIVSPETESGVEFNAIYQTPGGSLNFLYGYDSVYWFSNDGSFSGSEYEVGGRDFTARILQVVATPDDEYFALRDTDGIWIYEYDDEDGTITQLPCRFDWLDGRDDVLWLEVK